MSNRSRRPCRGRLVASWAVVGLLLAAASCQAQEPPEPNIVDLPNPEFVIADLLRSTAAAVGAAPCFDHELLLQTGFSCSEHRSFSNCDAQWLIEGDFCARTCRRCQINSWQGNCAPLCSTRPPADAPQGLKDLCESCGFCAIQREWQEGSSPGHSRFQESWQAYDCSAGAGRLDATLGLLRPPTLPCQSQPPLSKIECTPDGRIARLGTGAGLLGLQGPRGQLAVLPRALTLFSALTEINVAESRITGRIPPLLGDLSTLRVLSLFNNLLTGRIPASLGRLQNLETLELSLNRLEGPLPASLGAIPGLRTLNVAPNPGLCLPTDFPDTAFGDYAVLPVCGGDATPTADGPPDPAGPPSLTVVAAGPASASAAPDDAPADGPAFEITPILNRMPDAFTDAPELAPGT